ncbi:hypothetical protein DM860_009710 [Cuscuta australis]|uniref:protein-serine/threonine phosphatase n=1 Tax=Cuscuta australis TaxID=267555 RepID=A0A328DEI0_9ASTE|nr:hypothetical protein DM860_009710 [Cuscuta australis]
MDSCCLKRKKPPQIEIPIVLREISAGAVPSFRPPATATRNAAVRSSAKEVGVFSLKGRKKFMEDSHRIVSSHPKKGFFGVYDGHGGSQAAEFVTENLHLNIMECLKTCSGSGEDRDEAIKVGYLKTDRDFLEKGMCSGVCCVTALIEGDEVILSNLGDCRAVLSRGGSAEALTKDHRAGEDDERKRIEDKGGYVEIHRGAWRVHGVLSVSRSIGDAHLKEWVIAEPDTRRMCLTSDMQYLILASDGLWDKVENQEAVDVVMQSCQQGTPSQPKGTAGSTENVFVFNCKSTSPSSKTKRVSLVKSNKGNECEFGNENASPAAQRSPRAALARSSVADIWKEAEDDFGQENESPMKARRRSLSHSSIRAGCWSPCSNKRSVDGWKENEEKSSSCSLVAACKRLANLAVSRGSVDDVTVMIIDLDHFKDHQGHVYSEDGHFHF